MLYYTMLRRIYLKGLISKSLSDESVDSTDLETKVTEEILAIKLDCKKNQPKPRLRKLQNQSAPPLRGGGRKCPPTFSRLGYPLLGV